MPAFNPTGFTLLGDTTVSSPMDVNTYVGEINPNISYFAGDIATFTIFNAETGFKDVLPPGYIYPYPIAVSEGSPIVQALPLNYSKVGVFLYFTYTPVNTKIPIQSKFFIAGTPVAPNTKILATVSFSPTATYQVQVKTDVINPGECVPQAWLFSQLEVGCDTPQVVTLNGSGGQTWQLTFPLGSSDQFFGGSRSYLRKNSVAIEQDEITTPKEFDSILFFKMTDIEGSGFSTNTNQIPNPIVNCTFSFNSVVNPAGS